MSETYIITLATGVISFLGGVIAIVMKIGSIKTEMIKEVRDSEKEKYKEKEYITSRIDAIEEIIHTHISNDNLLHRDIDHQFKMSDKNYTDLKDFIEKQFKELWERIRDNEK